MAGENVQKTTFEAAEIMLGPWNQQVILLVIRVDDECKFLFWQIEVFAYYTHSLDHLHHSLPSLRNTVGKVSPILVTLTSRNDSNFESSNVSLKENKPDGVNPNSNDIDYYVRKNEGKLLWFSADCT